MADGGGGGGAAAAAEGRRVRRFWNARVLRGGRFVEGEVWTRGGVVIDPAARFLEAGAAGRDAADEEIDCRGLLLAPGFVDVQINGAVGVDFAALTPGREAEEVERVSRHLLRQGVTAYCPTVITSAPETYRRLAPFLEPRAGSPARAEVLGVHLEGPFISPDRVGAHPPALVRGEGLPRGLETAREVYGGRMLAAARLVTLAPELHGAPRAAGELRGAGVVVSAGHTRASCDRAAVTVARGVTMLTHLFNAMGAFHQRDPGVVAMVAASSPLTGRPLSYGLIADGVHSHPAAVRMAWRCNPRGAVLVTDAMSAQGLPPGAYTLGAQRVRVHAGPDEGGEACAAGGSAEAAAGRRATLEDDASVLAGSVVDLAGSVRNFWRFTGCTRAEAVECATLHPAEALGLERRKGNLDVGADADLVLLDDDLCVRACFVGARPAWAAPSLCGAIGAPPRPVLVQP